MRCASLLCALACAPASEDALELAVRLGPAEVDGQALTVEATSRWDLFGVRLRGCASASGRPTLAPTPRTDGFAGATSLRCVPSDVCGRRTDPVCCRHQVATAASWCELDLLPDVWSTEVEEQGPGTLVIAGTLENGAALDAWLDVPALAGIAEAPFTQLREETVRVNGVRRQVVRADALVLELGGTGWLTAVATPLANGEAVQVRPGDTAHNVMVKALVSQALLYVDEDKDSFLDDAERAEGPALSLSPTSSSESP